MLDYNTTLQYRAQTSLAFWNVGSVLLFVADCSILAPPALCVCVCTNFTLIRTDIDTCADNSILAMSTPNAYAYRPYNRNRNRTIHLHTRTTHTSNHSNLSQPFLRVPLPHDGASPIPKPPHLSPRATLPTPLSQFLLNGSRDMLTISLTLKRNLL